MQKTIVGGEHVRAASSPLTVMEAMEYGISSAPLL